MTKTPDAPLGKHLDCIQDPRRHNTRHRLYDILLIALCAIISGADGWTQVAEFGNSKIAWFKEFLELPNGIPSKDCVRRVLSMLKPAAFQECFQRWIGECLLGDADGSHRTIAIDGKTLKGTAQRNEAGEKKGDEEEYLTIDFEGRDLPTDFRCIRRNTAE